MSNEDSCLPFSEAEVKDQEATDNGEELMLIEAYDDNISYAAEIKEEEVEEDIFVKPTKQPKLKKDGTPRKMPTPEQIAKLAEARQKGLEKRRALKMAKDTDKEIKKQERQEKIQDQEDKLYQDEIVRKLVAEKTRSIQRGSVFDEDRLSALMEKTIENFMVKKKAEKEKRPSQKVAEPPQFIPNPYYSQQMQFQEAQRHIAPKPPARPVARRARNAEEELFGIFE